MAKRLPCPKQQWHLPPPRLLLRLHQKSKLPFGPARIFGKPGHTDPEEMKKRQALIIFAIFGSIPNLANAEHERDLCTDRPGLGTPACTIEPGQIMVEAGIVDWTLDRQSGNRSDIIQAAQMLTRIGLGDHLEAQIGWNGYADIRTRDTISGTYKAKGAGDIRMALRRNFINPDGSGTSLAIMPYAIIPIGRSPIGAGDWGAGIIAPVSYSLPHNIGIAFTPEIDAAVNQSGNGRHVAFGSVAGVSFPLTKALSLTSELSWFRDNDPSGHSSCTLSGFSLAWQPSKKLQFDIGTNIGVSGIAPDREIYFGVARRF
jgi:Putative MetA-pathway of phenol degradation